MYHFHLLSASIYTDIDECESQPCQHDASCLDGISSFTCICALGYTGPTCNDQILWCDSDPCLNGGSCVNEVDQFTCMCAPGYTGININNILYAFPNTFYMKLERG